MPLFRIMGGNRCTYPGQRAAQMPHNPQQPQVVLRGSHVDGQASSLSAGSTAPLPHPTPRSGAAPSQMASAPLSHNPTSTLSAPPSSSTSTTTSSTALQPPPQHSQPSRPGAYLVTRTTSGPAQVYRVTVPAGVRPGTEFTVHAGPRRVRVRCPPTSKPGQSLQITLPPEPTVHHEALHMAALTTLGDQANGGAVPMTPQVKQLNASGASNSLLVTIPDNIHPGMAFTVLVQGQQFLVTCPPNAGPRQTVRIVPPTPPPETQQQQQQQQLFEVQVPHHIRPGQSFALLANGQRVSVTCPPHVGPGETIRFQLPLSNSAASNVKPLDYESSRGWQRTLRAADAQFQWWRDTNQHSSSSDSTSQFDAAAYVRHLDWHEGNDARLRTATLTLIPADEARVDSTLVVHQRTLVRAADICATQLLPLDEKVQWFQTAVCGPLTGSWDDGHVKLVLRRRHLLADSVQAVLSLSREDLRKRWRLEMVNEPALDAGGVTREWFQLVTEQVMDPDFGLWTMSVNNQMCLNINPASGMSCPDDHLIYFRFLGRVLGRALFDRQLVKGHMVRTLYKHLLGWPITFEDLESQDEGFYQSLRKLTKMDDVSLMCLDFTVTEESMGVRTEVELVEGGAMKEVTNENLNEYLEANLRYRMLDRIKPQLTELLLGFFDVIPEAPLTVFDANELELILCGLPTIDMDDWERNTNYSGLFENKGKSAKAVQWFWEIVRDDFDTEMKARLLQFVTGTSGVPSRGFSVLQGNDGNIKKFTVHGVHPSMYPYPRAHTCFNRIDLPNFDTKDELKEKMRTAITMSGVGFDME